MHELCRFTRNVSFDDGNIPVADVCNLHRESDPKYCHAKECLEGIDYVQAVESGEMTLLTADSNANSTVTLFDPTSNPYLPPDMPGLGCLRQEECAKIVHMKKAELDAYRGNIIFFE